ncbi:hypothetical protein ACCS33_34630, partial [Rhizobium ruizarguesonis]
MFNIRRRKFTCVFISAKMNVSGGCLQSGRTALPIHQPQITEHPMSQDIVVRGRSQAAIDAAGAEVQ